MAKSVEELRELLLKKVEMYQEFVKNKDAFISKRAKEKLKAQKKLEQLNAVLDINNLSHMVDQFTYWDWEDVKELACTKRISVGEACTKYRKTLCSAIVSTARSGLKRYGRLLDVDAKHCVFIFENKQVSYERIYAGRYNIQCLHKRVLLK